MRKATSFLLRFIGVPERTESPDWWTYFGSFGNDIFGEEDTLMRSTSTDRAHETHSAIRLR